MTSVYSGVVLVCGAFGFAGVWYLLSLFGGKKKIVERPTENIRPESRTQWFEVLGVSETADDGAIKAAYLREIAKYHPDKFASFGPDFQSVASERARAINDAFDKSKHPRQ